MEKIVANIRKYLKEIEDELDKIKDDDDDEATQNSVPEGNPPPPPRP